MSSDSDSDLFDITTDVKYHMSNLQEKFMQKFKPNIYDQRQTIEISDNEETSVQSRLRPRLRPRPKPRLKLKPKRQPVKWNLRSLETMEPMPSTSMASSVLIESDEDGASINQVLDTKRKKSSNKKASKKMKIKTEEKERDVHDESTDEDVREIVDKNPLVLVNILWRSIEKKKFAVRKFSNLTVICDYLVKTYAVNPKLLLFTVNDKEIDLKNNTYVSLCLNNNITIEGGVLPESYLGKENLNCEQKGGVKVKVQYEEQKSFHVHLMPGEKLDVVYSEVTKKLNLPFDKFKVKFDGEVVKHSDSVGGLGVEEGDVFDIVVI